MILQALTEYYEALAAQGEIASPGWTEADISYVLCINSDGILTQTICVKNFSADGKKMIPQTFNLPKEPSGRTSGSKPAFLWDKSKYLLGVEVDKTGHLHRRLEHFRDCASLYHRILDSVDSPAANAVLAFFDHWDPLKAENHPALQEDVPELFSGTNLIFRLDGQYIHEDPKVRQAWQAYYSNADGGQKQTCLVTGKQSTIAKTHYAIKGVGGTNPKLVSFDKDSTAFCSYGKEQGFNAPVGEHIAFAYATALNHLLKNHSHICQAEGTTIIFWAQSTQSAFQDFFSACAFGGASPYDPGELAGMLDSLVKGNSVQYDETLLDPNMGFYILGLSPNKGRLSVRFFLHNSFGSFLKNVQRHYERLDIVRPTKDSFETIPLWKLLDATVNQSSRDKLPSPIMAGEVLRAILTDTRYPATLLNGVTLRIRADHKVDRVRAAILKAYYLKAPHPDISKEVLTVSLNPACDDPAYVLGRLFSVYEAIQSDANPGINTTIKDKYFNSAAATPATIFPILGSLARNHLKKLKGSNIGRCVFYEKQLGELSALLSTSFPVRLSLPQQGAFQLGYYHQTQSRYQKKEENKNV